MYRKPKTAFINYQIKTLPRSRLLSEISDAPLKKRDLIFLEDIIAGLSYKELAVKYNLTTSTIYKWKRNVYEKLADFMNKKNLFITK